MPAAMKCPSCNAVNNVEMVTTSPRGSREQIPVVQCAAWGAAVGVLDYFSIASVLDDLKAIKEKLGIYSR